MLKGAGWKIILGAPYFCIKNKQTNQKKNKQTNKQKKSFTNFTHAKICRHQHSNILMKSRLFPSKCTASEYQEGEFVKGEDETE